MAALKGIDKLKGATAINLGRGIGSTVMEVVRAFEAACGRSLSVKIGPRRSGDVPRYFADPGLANTLLDWRAEYDVARACADTWRWQSKNTQRIQK